MKCKESRVQEYQCHIELKPFWNSSKKRICIDKCLKEEILNLWGLGIITGDSCCGCHENCNYNGYISVEPEFIDDMIELGYNVRFNHFREEDGDPQDGFIPKTNFRKMKKEKQND